MIAFPQRRTQRSPQVAEKPEKTGVSFGGWGGLVSLAQKIDKKLWNRQESFKSAVKNGLYCLDERGELVKESSSIVAQGTAYREILSKAHTDQKPEILIVGNLHPDEAESALLWGELPKNAFGHPRLEILNAQLAGKAWQKRHIVKPLSEKEILGLRASNIGKLEVKAPRKKSRLSSSKEGIEAERLQGIISSISDLYNKVETRRIAQDLFKKHSLELRRYAKEYLKPKEQRQNTVKIGYKVNLNREFYLKPGDKSWSAIFKRAKHQESKILQKILSANPQLKYVFSIHEDSDFDGGEFASNKGGFYFYDTWGKNHTDELASQLSRLRERLMNSVTLAGIAIHSGVDDDSDPTLGYTSKKGYVQMPLKLKNGKLKLDGSFEGFAVFTGHVGLTQIQRAFCFEIPGKMPTKKKKKLLQIIRDEFMVPFLEAQT